jgi:hypothetical protein
MKPGEKIRMNKLKYPDVFINAVKYLMDLKAIPVGDYSFSPDYSVLLRHNHELQTKSKINRGIYA